MPSVDVGLVDLLFHPPLGVLAPYLDYHGPFYGYYTFTVWGSTPGPTIIDRTVGDTFGLIVSVNGSIPTGLGFTNGWISSDLNYDESRYDERLAQIVVQHQFASGGWVTTQVANVHTIPALVMWETALPGRIGLLTSPAVEIDMYYLMVP
jgi:hypothetical protein